MTDHDRGCEGRQYTCTCGYDDSRDAIIDRLTKALEPFAKAVEKADAAAERMGFAPSFDAYSTDWTFTFRELRSAKSAIAGQQTHSPQEQFSQWLQDGPKLAKAAGVYVGISVKPLSGSQTKEDR